MGSFPPKFIIKVGMIATVGIQKRVAFWKPGGRPPYIRKSCTPPPGGIRINVERPKNIVSLFVASVEERYILLSFSQYICLG